MTTTKHELDDWQICFSSQDEAWDLVCCYHPISPYHVLGSNLQRDEHFNLLAKPPEGKNMDSKAPWIWFNIVLAATSDLCWKAVRGLTYPLGLQFRKKSTLHLVLFLGGGMQIFYIGIHQTFLCWCHRPSCAKIQSYELTCLDHSTEGQVHALFGTWKHQNRNKKLCRKWGHLPGFLISFVLI